MGIMKEAKAQIAGKHARRAAEEGHRVLVFRMDLPRVKLEGTPVSGIAEQIEAIEAEGWRLDQMTGGDSAVLLFRR